MIKVSVLVMTYNHEKFIRQALNSVLDQETKFEFEILISEDASADQTRIIVLEYSKRYPDKIRLLLSDKNLHNNKIVERGIIAAKGNLIALLDGDDFWTSPLKLQKQFDFLDSHPDFSMCFHNALVVDESNLRQPENWTPAQTSPVTTMNDLWFGNYIATSSAMFRKDAVKNIPEWYAEFFPITDWPLHLLNAEHGKIGFMNETMSIYRQHKGGMYSPFSESKKQEQTLEFYQKINRCFNWKYNKIIGTAISKYFYEWADEYLNRCDYENARRCVKVCFKGRPLNKYVSLRRLLKIILRVYSIQLFSARNNIKYAGSK